MREEVLLQRLLVRYQEHGSLTVAVDFDNTLFDFHFENEQQIRSEYDFSEIYVLLRRLKRAGCYIIIWTANANEQFIKSFLFERKVPFDAVNENPLFFKSTSRKIYYNVLLDDAAGLGETYALLSKFLSIVQPE